MLPIEWTPQAQDDFSRLSYDLQNRIQEKIEALADDGPLNHEDVLLIEDPRWGAIWRLKVKSDTADHRIFFDLINSSTIRIERIYHRGVAYDTKNEQ